MIGGVNMGMDIGTSPTANGMEAAAGLRFPDLPVVLIRKSGALVPSGSRSFWKASRHAKASFPELCSV